jgi:hypothetical protein
MAKHKFTGGGSRRGRPNKLRADMKGMILAALEGAGRQRYLEDHAVRHPAAFMRLLAKLLPQQMRADQAAPLIVVTGVRRAGDDPAA